MFGRSLAADSMEELRQALTFHAAFDRSPDADFARGDSRVYTAPGLERLDLKPGLPAGLVELDPSQGRWGGSLKFNDITEKVVVFRGKDNVPFASGGYGLTVSFWLSVDPEKGLKPGYVDPLQITDKAWNNSCLFVDFTKDDLPRHFRLGVFSDYAFWNPQNIDWDHIAVADRPMVDVSNPPFGPNRWTHVAFTLSRINESDSPGEARFFLDGRFQGKLAGPHKMTWDIEKLTIRLGIQYIGHVDDLAVFNRPLADNQIVEIVGLKGGIHALRTR
jgi:hypothetical protein